MPDAAASEMMAVESFSMVTYLDGIVRPIGSVAWVST
mgnify:CR=1 FL=1